MYLMDILVVPVIQDTSVKELISTFCSISRICGSPSFHVSKLLQTQNLIETWCWDYEKVFGKQACTQKYHQMIHLIPSIVKFGPTWASSAYSYESYYGALVNMVHGTNDTFESAFVHAVTKQNLSNSLSDNGTVTALRKLVETHELLFDQIDEDLFVSVNSQFDDATQQIVYKAAKWKAFVVYSKGLNRLPTTVEFRDSEGRVLL